MRSRLLIASVAVAVVALLWIGCSVDAPVSPADTQSVAGDAAKGAAFAIAPIPGLTTAWHPVPAQTALPVGVTVELRRTAAPGDEVTWTGATEIRRSDKWSIAECPIRYAGTHSVSVAVRPAQDDHDGKGGDGDIHTAPPVTHTCVINAMDVPVEKIRIEAAAVTVSPFDLHDNANNMETMRVFMNAPSIATLRQVGDDHYVTSIKKPVTIATKVNPPEFGPLAEWRINGRAVRLGKEYLRMIHEPGTHIFSVGPPNASREIRIDAYSVTITSHKNERDFVNDGGVATFKAVTDPPGYEDNIRWISTTRFGTATPVVGYGSTFTAQFVDTWGKSGQQWLGVRADNAAFSQDNKAVVGRAFVDTLTVPADYCLYSVTSIIQGACPGVVVGGTICFDCPSSGACPFPGRRRRIKIYNNAECDSLLCIVDGTMGGLCAPCPGGGASGYSLK